MLWSATTARSSPSATTATSWTGSPIGSCYVADGEVRAFEGGWSANAELVRAAYAPQLIDAAIVGARMRVQALVSSAAVVLAAVTSFTALAAPSKDGIEQFTSRPDLKPTAVRFGKRDLTSGSGSIFTAPKSVRGVEKTLSGPMIIAPDGRLVWFKYVRGGAYAFRAQVYEGKPVLTWWQGDVQRGFGYGEGVIYDQSYRRIATVKTGKGQRADLHEFVITPQNTALLIAYKIVRGDLRAVKGGSKNDLVMDNIVQEVDIKTGKVLLDWHTFGSSLPASSYTAVPNDAKLPYDYASEFRRARQRRQPAGVGSCDPRRLSDQPPDGQADGADRRQGERLSDGSRDAEPRGNTMRAASTPHRFPCTTTTPKNARRRSRSTRRAA